MFKGMTAVFAFLLALCGQSFAQTDAYTADVDSQTLDVARELLHVTKADEGFMRSYTAVVQRMLPVLAQANPDPSRQQLLKTVMDDVYSPLVKKHLPEIVDRAAVVYAHNFSADEMQQIIDFYRTPIGQKYLAKNVAMGPELTQAMQAVNQELTREAMQQMADKLRQNNLQVPQGMEAKSP